MADDPSPTTLLGDRKPVTARSDFQRSKRRLGLLLALPTLVLLVLIIGIPVVQAFVFSLQDVAVGPADETSFVGVENWIRTLSSGLFWESVRRTVVFAAGFTVISTGFGLLFALLLNAEFRGRALARALLIIPWASPWLIIGIMWRWFLDGDVGALNGLLVRLGITDLYTPFLSRPGWAMLFIILAASWRQASLAGLLLLSGLQTLPRELPEAAKIDGAGMIAQLRYVTIPWLRPVLAGVVILNVIYAFLQFDVIFAMTQGGPGEATMLLSILMYRELFVFSEFGVGSVIAILLGMLAIVGSLFAAMAIGRDDVETR